MRWDVVGILVLACAHCILMCKQKDSSLEVKSSDWPHMESSCAYTSSAYNWWALGAFGLKDTCFLKYKLVKYPYLWWCKLIFLGRTLEIFQMSGIPTLGISISTCMGLLRIKLLKWWHLLFTCILLVTVWSWLESLFLCLLGGRSVPWCLSKLIWAT